MAQWIRHLASNQGIAGSSPVADKPFCIALHCFALTLYSNSDLCQVSAGLVNGARGRVESFSSVGTPMVRFVGGAVQEVKQEKWTVKGGPGVLLTRTQLPLRLAWAFSIHKSQGMTLDCVEVSLGKVFESGQTYVALSRAKNLKSIR